MSRPYPFADDPSPPFSPSSSQSSSSSTSTTPNPPFTFPSLLPNAREPWKVLFEAGWECFRFLTSSDLFQRTSTLLQDLLGRFSEHIRRARDVVMRRWDEWVTWWNEVPEDAVRLANEDYEENAARMALMMGGDLEEVRYLIERREYPFTNLRRGGRY
ncbi:hypothetical protein BU23DRAFT_641642 [Bimuria novae-zelandiae CBS 107.79]|uniref:Uncharacterized protein n=1 Tax=Bimuria novae-zelandiae CBS 107.79 TaxID=1447943 RepID=A0A6A5VHN2_9PLEO|nr:hypothetical protein BU23DRAFT_641642 [Bimuria novae-zelandiae CBS 107.79]